MRVLLSAYACEPNVGSEPGIGWRWAIEVAKLGHDVTVITPRSKKKEIVSEMAKSPYPNLNFVFYEPSRFLQWVNWHKLWPFKFGHRMFWFTWEHIYHFAWQYGAFRAVREIHLRDPFDIVHHITYGVARRATFMGHLEDAQFIFGPLGGGERSPWRLRSLLPKPAILVEAFRDISIYAAKVNPFLWNSYKKASIVYLKTAESEFLIPKRFRNKARIRLEIGRDTVTLTNTIHKRDHASNDPFKVLFVGRFLYWKGMAYGIHAFTKLVKNNPDARLVIIGAGPEEQRWRKLSRNLGIDLNIDWVPWVNRDELKQYYESSDIFLFPSLHDSSGNVVLESLSNGLPVVCFDLGGPATIVDETCARICPTKGKDCFAAIDGLYRAMKELSEDRNTLCMMRDAAIKHSAKYIWSNIVREVYHDAATLPLLNNDST